MADEKAATTAPAEGSSEKEAPKRRKKKLKRSVTKARACIFAGDNNTIITITDLDGSVLGWSSAGAAGFKGSRKSTPYAAKVAAEKAMEKVATLGIQSMDIEVTGIGPGREQAIRGLQTSGIPFDAIVDTTPIAHGGCRPPKPRRI
jgi:small subunit ribosomal protein S11